MHVDVFAPTITSPGFEQLKARIVPTTATPLASEMCKEDPLIAGYWQVAVILSHNNNNFR